VFPLAVSIEGVGDHLKPERREGHDEQINDAEPGGHVDAANVALKPIKHERRHEATTETRTARVRSDPHGRELDGALAFRGLHCVTADTAFGNDDMTSCSAGDGIVITSRELGETQGI
jgi:hypothetical protein